MAVAADSALASVAVVSSVGLGQATFSTPSHVQLSGSRASSFEAELERSAFSSDLLMPSCLAEKKLLFFQEQEARQDS
jgi:hypothetical protein